MTGTEFSTAVEEINGGDPIASTLRFQFGNLGKNLIEQRRPWMILRKTDTSKTVTAASTWQNLDRPLNNHRLQPVLSNALRPVPDPSFRRHEQNSQIPLGPL
jgi:hypothetical protein